MAPFNRYQTLDVVRGVADSGRADEIALYTGNDDNIIPTCSPNFASAGGTCAFAADCWGSGRCGRGARSNCWRDPRCRDADGTAPPRFWPDRPRSPTPTRALFDVRNRFAGCIAGMHEILRRQGLLAGRWCLDPAEDLSPGQMEEIDRVCAAYPQLTDDDFVRENLDEWLK